MNLEVELTHIVRLLTRMTEALEDLVEAANRDQHVTLPAGPICNTLYLPQDMNEGPRSCVLPDGHEGEHSWNPVNSVHHEAQTMPPKTKTCKCGANAWGAHPNPEHSDVVVCQHCGRGFIKDENGDPKL